MIKVLAYVILTFAFISPLCWSAEVVLINRPLSKNDNRSDYAIELLRAALVKTEPQYPPAIINFTLEMNEERAKSLIIKENYGDVIYAATRESWEQELIPIKVPLLKGLMGMRVLMIRKEQQQEFSAISTIEQLKKLHLGSGHIWAITQIFEQAGFKVIKSSKYESLFKMLVKQRFDFLPRGVNEIINEYQLRRVEYPSLHIEESILLKVPLPVYFFINPKKPELAQRILKGLNIMIADGSFDEIFNQHFSADLQFLNIDNRKVFEINPPAYAHH
ncbi:MAG: hypothetical protein ACSHW0_17775 [Thalassotalea sp.]